MAAAASAGFALEQLFSGGNDGEPDVAADPGSSYVYKVTTGLDADVCQQFVEPSILIRVSSDAGATCGERSATVARKPFIDPTKEIPMR